jgi:hypothetical protein
MAGSRPLVCHGFIETDLFEQAKERLKQLLEWTDRDIDDRLEALIWAFQHDPDPDDAPLTRKIPERNLWVARTDHPHLRIYLRPRPEVPDECELVWIEEGD